MTDARVKLKMALSGSLVLCALACGESADDSNTSRAMGADTGMATGGAANPMTPGSAEPGSNDPQPEADAAEPEAGEPLSAEPTPTGGAAPPTPSATVPTAGSEPMTGGEPDTSDDGPEPSLPAGPDAAADDDPAGIPDPDSAPDETEAAPDEPLEVNGSAFAVEYQLASDVEPAAPTTVGIVTWSTTLAGMSAARIEFGLDTDYGMTAPVDLSEPEYRTLLLGMKPAREYHFRVVVEHGTSTTASEDYIIETGSPPQNVSIGAFNVIDEAAREPGFIVASYWQGDSASVGFILDPDGDIVWWYDFQAGGIARMRMSASGKNMWMVVANNSGGPLQRVGMDGLGGETYMATSGSHDLTPVAGETMAYLDYGESDCDSIFEIEPSGETREVWESDATFGASGGGGFGGGCHGNALRYSEAEDVYTFSDVGQDIAVVSRSGELQWLLSELTEGGNQAWAARNHGHQLLPSSFLIYANDGGSMNSSAALEYELDSGAEIFRYDSGDASANLGDVQRLPKGNTLVTHSNASKVHEVDAERRLVMEWDGAGSRIGYTLWRQSLYGPPPDLAQ